MSASPRRNNQDHAFRTWFTVAAGVEIQATPVLRMPTYSKTAVLVINLAHRIAGRLPRVHLQAQTDRCA